ncbi:hypothetical protein NQ318_018092 [Aromia moschata]
MYLHD